MHIDSILSELLESHGKIGWDGVKAPALSKATIVNVRAFILTLPPWVPDPEFAVDPDDGAVSIEWYGGHARNFSVSVGQTNRLACAGIDGTDSWHGVVDFKAVKTPDFVLQSIQRILA
jgi:hypothetical protein